MTVLTNYYALPMQAKQMSQLTAVESGVGAAGWLLCLVSQAEAPVAGGARGVP